MPRYRQQIPRNRSQQAAIIGGGGSLPTDLQAMNQATEREIFAREQMDAEMRSKNLAIDTVQNEEQYYRDREAFDRADKEREAYEFGRAGAIDSLISMDVTADDYSDQFGQLMKNLPAAGYDDPAIKTLLSDVGRRRTDHLESVDKRRVQESAIVDDFIKNSNLDSSQIAEVRKLGLDGASYENQQDLANILSQENSIDTVKDFRDEGFMSVAKANEFEDKLTDPDISDADKFKTTQNIQRYMDSLEKAGEDNIKILSANYNLTKSELKDEKKSLEKMVATNEQISKASTTKKGYGESDKEFGDRKDNGAAAQKAIAPLHTRITAINAELTSLRTAYQEAINPKKTKGNLAETTANIASPVASGLANSTDKSSVISKTTANKLQKENL